jgi:hypothetical protein
MVYAQIPKDILEVAFRPKDYGVTIDRRIQDVVVSGRVLPDCNINAGKIKRIPLSVCVDEQVLPDPGLSTSLNPSPGSLYRVPANARENRDIVGVIDITYLYDYAGFSDSPVGFGAIGNTVRTMAAAMLSSQTGRNNNLTPTPVLLAGNMVLINPTNSFINDWTLVCRLAYDEEFTNINNAAVLPLAQLITTATKSYVWTNLVVRIDQAALSGGQEIGQFKTIVDKYESAEEQYRADLQRFRGAALFDPDATRYFLRKML